MGNSSQRLIGRAFSAKYGGRPLPHAMLAA
jgi:hypothetical protein